jgi:hypothetical protein
MVAPRRCDGDPGLVPSLAVGGAHEVTVPSEGRLKLVILRELLDGSDGVADVTVAQAPGPERTGTVLAERRQTRQGTSDAVRHRRDLAADFCPCSGVTVDACSQPRCLGGVPSRAEGVRPHVRDGGGLLGRVRRCSSRWCRRIAGSGTCRSAPTSHRLGDVEFAVSEGASLLDRGSHPVIVRFGVLEDARDVFGAVGRPPREDAAVIDAQRLRGSCHPVDTRGLTDVLVRRRRGGERSTRHRPGTPVGAR